MPNTTERPDFLTDEHLAFLDDLRTSGVTNMYGACPYLVQEFSLKRKDAGVILTYWMQTFAQRGAPRGNGDFEFGQPERRLRIRRRT